MKTITVEMDNQGRCDWAALKTERDSVRHIVGALSECLVSAEQHPDIQQYVSACPLLWHEAHQVARLGGVSSEEIVLVNVLYDWASSRCACTAFAVDGEEGPLHGHTLDWEIGRDALRAHARLFEFAPPGDAPGFVSSGWPGFLGLYVASAPRRFSVTVNAVWSEDMREVGEPLGMTLRRSIATLADYEELVAFLMQCELACDCLLLVTGVRSGEMSVVERTPGRAAARTASDGLLLLTNHYIEIRAGANAEGYVVTGEEPFGLGTYERYSRAAERLKACRPRRLEDCYEALGQEPFSHDMTVQRSALSAASSRLLVSTMPATNSDATHEKRGAPWDEGR